MTMSFDPKAILNAEYFDGRSKYLSYKNNTITFTQILIIPNLTCSLRCKYCAAGNQYAKRKVFDPQQTVDDFDKLMGVCRTKQVNIQGGEVFVNPKIAEFFYAFSKMKNISNCETIAIFTNATVIPNEEQLTVLSEISLPIKFMISNYDLPNVKVDGFVKAIEGYGFNYDVFPVDKWWFHPGDPRCETGFTDEELKEVCKKCTKFGRAAKLIDGRFFICGQNGYAIYDKLHDFVDVRNCPDDMLKERLFSHVYKQDSYDICKYCRGVYEGCELVPAAEQL